MSHSAKNAKGDPLGFSNIHYTVAKKIEKGDPSVSSAFVGYVKKSKK